MSMTKPGMVIVGAGEAGARAARLLRELGWDGSIILIGAENHLPYERPPLTKATMVAEGEAMLPATTTAAQLAELQIAYCPGTRVAAIEPAAHTLQLSDGTMLPYAKLLLATGASARRLALPGAERAHYLRTFDDTLALRAALRPGQHVAIVGGGFIGLELAASAVERGCAVTVLESAPRLLMRGVPPEIASLLAARHGRAGVSLHLDASIACIEAGERSQIIFANRPTLTVDCLVAGIGSVPQTALAAAAGLAIENGIAVNSHLQTSHPDIFAAGDCCSFPHPLYDHRRIRLEARRNALDHGAIAAANMLGQLLSTKAVPWFWSDQYDVHLQIAGLSDGAASHVSRDLGSDACLIFHLAADGRLLAASGAGPIGKIAKEIKLAEMLIARRAKPGAATLSDPDIRLKSLL